MLLGIVDDFGDDDDRTQVRYMLEGMPRAPADLGRYELRLRQMARMLVRRHRKRIERVANELKRRMTLEQIASRQIGRPQHCRRENERAISGSVDESRRRQLSNGPITRQTGCFRPLARLRPRCRRRCRRASARSRSDQETVGSTDHGGRTETASPGQDVVRPPNGTTRCWHNWIYRTCGTDSLRRDARELDHLGPFLSFGCNNEINDCLHVNCLLGHLSLWWKCCGDRKPVRHLIINADMPS